MRHRKVRCHGSGFFFFEGLKMGIPARVVKFCCLCLFWSGLSLSLGSCGSNSNSPAMPVIVPLDAPSIPYASPLSIAGTESNVMPITVGCQLVNEPCVSVTVCQAGGLAGSNHCVTIPNILLDTGSQGLRVFASAVPFSLPARTDPASGNPLAECQPYADGTSDWGSLVTADVLLGNGNDRAANIPIQLINSSFATVPSNCTQPDTDPVSAKYNGVLGVGLFAVDCGDGCATNANNGLYFACAGSTCHPVAVSVDHQVSNPVTSLASGNNNGVIIQLPSVTASGTATLSGFMILGVGTQADNKPSSTATFFQADSSGEIGTAFAGTMYGAVIDSGSNAIYFPDTNLPQCTSSNISQFYCPASPTNLFGIVVGNSSSVNDKVTYQVTDAYSALVNSVAVDPGLGGTNSGFFDWGLPFFFGKSVYMGLDGKSSSLGTGMYWAF
ncbi:MAG: hypothetical protein C5B49_13450 [Bdellovibrio sp.]|nr:MAG: hypothetical protein C5B49_13450 [Bdellovibrio sp.]